MSQKMILCDPCVKWLKDGLFKVKKSSMQPKLDEKAKCEWCRQEYKPADQFLKEYEVYGR